MKNEKIENLNNGMRAYHEGHYETAAKLLMPLATEGNDEAQYYVAMLYLSGEGGKYKPNYEEAIKWLQLSSEQSHPQAQTELGYLYYTGEGTDTNQARAVILYEQAVVLDYAPAKANLGMAYVFGNGTEQKLDEGIQLLSEAIDAGEINANYLLGGLYEQGVKDNINNQNLLSDIDKAIKYYKLAAESNPDAAYRLFLMYYNGDKILKNHDQAVKYLKLGADNYHGNSQYELGRLYLYGEIIEQDFAEAEKYFALSALKGDNDARVMVSIAIESQIDSRKYEEIEEVKKSQIDMMFFWLNKAVDEKHPPAIHQLAIRYAKGNKIEQDLDKSIKLFLEAHELGYPESTYSLGIMYLQGQGIEENRKTALEYFKIAATKDMIPAQKNSALLLEDFANEFSEGSDEKSQLLKESLDMHKLAADQGDIESSFDFARLCVQHIIHKDIANDPFSYFNKDDYMPYLEAAAADGYEQAEELLKLTKKVQQKIDARDERISSSNVLDKFFTKNNLNEIKDLARLVNRKNFIKFLKESINEEILMKELIKCYLPENHEYDEFKTYLEDHDFISEYDRDNFFNIWNLLSSSNEFDLTRILFTDHADETRDVEDTIIDEYYIFNDIVERNQWLIKVTGNDSIKLKVLGYNKKYTSRSLKSIFMREQLNFGFEVKEIYIHRDLLNKKDEYQFYEDSPLIKNFSYFKEYEKFLFKKNKKRMASKIACYPLNNWLTHLPMTKQDCINWLKETGHSNLLNLQEKFRGDWDIAKLCVNTWGWNINNASETLKKDPELIQIANQSKKRERKLILNKLDNFDLFNQYNEMLSAEKDIILPYISRRGWAFEDIDDSLKNDRDVALAACKNWGKALESVQGDLQHDEEIVHAAISQNPAAIKYASEKFKLDKKLNLRIVSENGCLIEDIHESFRSDKDILSAALSSRPRTWIDSSDEVNVPAFTISLLWNFDLIFQKDHEIIMRTIKRDLDIINEIIDDKESDKPIYAEQYHYDHYEDYMEIFTDYICEQDLVDDSSFMKKLEKSFPKIFDEVMTELK